NQEAMLFSSDARAEALCVPIRNADESRSARVSACASSHAAMTFVREARSCRLIAMKANAALGGLACLAGIVATDATAGAAGQRSYSETATVIMVDGADTGDRVTATVTDVQTAAGTTSDVVLGFQPHASTSPLLGWASSFINGTNASKNLQILSLDFSLN